MSLFVSLATVCFYVVAPVAPAANFTSAISVLALMVMRHVAMMTETLGGLGWSAQ
jgi:hypothetical protein